MDRSRDFGASARERLSDLHGAVSDHNIKGVFCARGGYGVSEIVGDVDYALIHRNPKVIVGFSDVTLLHLAIQNRAGLVTFHGRMPALTKFPPYSLDALRRAVCSPEPLGRLANPEEANTLRPLYPLRTITPGAATGRLVGGNLSMIAAAMGTPWEIDTRDAIFFFEDVDEHPYAIARMLLELRQAGKLTQAKGIVIGVCADCDKTSDASPYTLNEVFDDVLGDPENPGLFRSRPGPYGRSASPSRWASRPDWTRRHVRSPFLKLGSRRSAADLERTTGLSPVGLGPRRNIGRATCRGGLTAKRATPDIH